jgi:phosphatidylserine decarboxylase
MKQYDADSTSALSHIEITSMLDSLGSTLSSSTISNFYTRFGKKVDDELTFEEAILCLEEELNRPEDQKKRLDTEEFDSSLNATPVLLQLSHDRSGNMLQLDQLDFSGPANLHIPDDSNDTPNGGNNKIPPVTSGTKTEPMQVPLHQAAAAAPPTTSPPMEFSSDDAEEDLSSGSTSPSPFASTGMTSLTPINPPPRQTKKARFRRKGKAIVTSRIVKKAADQSPSSGTDDNYKDDGVERVINVKSCPLCHRPRMNSKAEMDIMTHIAVCASQDWNRVDKIVVGNFVTTSQAQRKWYTKVISKLSSGDYKLGAVSFPFF